MPAAPNGPASGRTLDLETDLAKNWGCVEHDNPRVAARQRRS